MNTALIAGEQITVTSVSGATIYAQNSKGKRYMGLPTHRHEGDYLFVAMRRNSPGLGTVVHWDGETLREVGVGVR